MEEPPSVISQRESQESREKFKAEFFELGKQLSESGEHFPFPGLTSDAYAALKKVDAEYPGYTTPIDTLIARCTTEGMKVMMSGREGNKDFFILPALSSDIESGSVFPRHLNLEEIQNSDLRQLVVLHRALKNE